MGRTYDCKLIFGIKVNFRDNDNVLTSTTYVGIRIQKCVFFANIHKYHWLVENYEIEIQNSLSYQSCEQPT